MDFPWHVDRISMGLPFLYFKGSHRQLLLNHDTLKKVSMIMKYPTHTPQTNPRHCEEEPQNTKSQDTRKTTKVKQPASTEKDPKYCITKQCSH